MTRIENKLYLEDVGRIASLELPWEKLQNKTILLSGATGTIGSFLTDVLMFRNREYQMGCTVLALTRSPEKAAERATSDWAENVHFLRCDLNKGLPSVPSNVDFVIHAASNTHPVAYASDPIGTIMTNIVGTQNMLELAAEKQAERCVFLSSVEIYGENRGDTERFTENYCGYIDCNTMRAGYPEGKRAGEALCQAYIRQKGLDIVITRLPRIYGPTMLPSDSKAISQFMRKGVSGEDVVLKSEGNQLFSYCYVADAVSAILHCLFFGACGEAYNVSDPGSDITLKDLAKLIADASGTKVVFALPEGLERQGYSTATVAVMDSAKLQAKNWKAQFHIRTGIERTLRILKEFG